MRYRTRPPLFSLSTQDDGRIVTMSNSIFIASRFNVTSQLWLLVANICVQTLNVFFSGFFIFSRISVDYAGSSCRCDLLERLVCRDGLSRWRFTSDPPEVHSLWKIERLPTAVARSYPLQHRVYLTARGRAGVSPHPADCTSSGRPRLYWRYG